MQTICLFLLLLSRQKKKKKSWNFPGGPVVNTPYSQHREHGFESLWANQDPTCAQQGKKKKKKKKNHCQDQYQEACFPVSFLVFLWFQVSGLHFKSNFS